MIRWIRPRLGTAPYDGIASDAYTVVDVRHLLDKTGNPRAAIEALLSQGTSAYERGETVVVACDFGISRSNALAAGILSRVDGLAYNAALDEVVARTGEREIKLDLADAVASALQPEVPKTRERQAVLVTGASGFLGRALVPRLERDMHVLTPRSADLDLTTDAIALARLCDREGVGQIVHLAYPRTYTNVASVSASIAMVRNVLDVARTRDIRLVYASGSVVFSAYEDASLSVDESVSPFPKGVYGESKFLEEQLVGVYAKRGDVRSIIARLAPVYGPGGNRPRLLQTFYARAMRGEIIVTHRYSNGLPTLDLLYIDDAVDALARAIASDLDGTIHFSAGKPLATVEIAAKIAKIAGVHVPFEELVVEGATSNVTLDAAKAHRVLNWAARTEVEDGLRHTLLSGAPSIDGGT